MKKRYAVILFVFAVMLLVLACDVSKPLTPFHGCTWTAVCTEKNGNTFTRTGSGLGCSCGRIVESMSCSMDCP